LIKIARIASRDWPTLRDLRLRALADAPSALLGDYRVEAKESHDYWRERCSAEVWLSAEIRGKPIGIGKLSERSGARECMHIESMWIEPTARHRGVARALIRGLEAEAQKRGECEIALWVFTTNEIARDFYLRAGYRGPLREQTIESGGKELVEEEFRKDLTEARQQPSIAGSGLIDLST
jgi:GNAT superfamily N-acetyltransferase